MPEPDIIQQQRKLLRTFYGTDTQYAQAEAEIEAQWRKAQRAVKRIAQDVVATRRNVKRGN